MNISQVVREFNKRNSAKRLRVAVVGDTLVDEYRYGKVNRISPEFPVPVLTSEAAAGERLPGGAANVCHQMTHMNADVFLVGFVDPAARSLYEKFSFGTDYCVNLTDGNVPTKVRFYEGDFPLLRWDIERPGYGESDLGAARKKILDNLSSLVHKGLDAVIVSDYDKGMFADCRTYDCLSQEVVRLCRGCGVVCVVDPKRPPLWKWAGATAIKPNALEAKILTGETILGKQLDKLSGTASHAVITQGGSGVVGQTAQANFEYSPPTARDIKGVSSVIGAGDCYISVLTLALSHGMTAQESAAVAFEAGAVYVRARHNRPITVRDVLCRVDPAAAKVTSAEELSVGEKKVVFSSGCFDFGLTKGHVDCLAYAKSQGDVLVVGINDDASVTRLKGAGRPVMPLNERMAVLASLSCVDFVVPFSEDTPLELIKKLRAAVVVKGADYKPQEVVGHGLAEVRVCPLSAGLSTTEKIGRLA